MSTRQNKTKVILPITFQALAVAIICLGSLINFHQYKIWGKPLIHEFVGYKRDHEKSLKQVPPVKYYSTDSGNNLHFSAETPIWQNYGCELMPVAAKVFFAEAASCRLPFSPASCGLRAPPSV